MEPPKPLPVSRQHHRAEELLVRGKIGGARGNIALLQQIRYQISGLP